MIGYQDGATLKNYLAQSQMLFGSMAWDLVRAAPRSAHGR
jgi:hypothetical protein